MATIFLHEVHEISGGAIEPFEESFRDRYRPALESPGDSRLLWFWHLTHGTGPSYQVVTITAFDGWPSFSRYVDRISLGGDLHSWSREIASVRREVTSKLLQPVAWSALQGVDFSAAPAKKKGLTDPASAAGAAAPGASSSALEIYLHDTGWPFPGKLDDYIEALGRVLYPQTQNSKMISIDACFVTCPGTGRHNEVLILQRILDWQRYAAMLAGGEGPARSGPARGGDWMNEGLKYRDRWESKLLRTALWSRVPVS